MHKSARQRSRKELVFFDPENRRSIINLVPESIAILVRKLWSGEDSYLLGMPESKLLGELTRRGKRPTSTDNRIRLQFWLEYDRIQATKLGTSEFKMDMAYVIGFAMGKEAFYAHYITDPLALAWILCVPVSYHNAVEEALRESTERLREAIGTDFVKKNGEPNTSHLQFLLRADQILFQRWNALNKHGISVPEEESDDDRQSATKAASESAIELRKEKIAKFKAELAEKAAREKREADEASAS